MIKTPMISAVVANNTIEALRAFYANTIEALSGRIQELETENATLKKYIDSQKSEAKSATS